MDEIDLSKEYAFGNSGSFGDLLSKLVGPALSIAGLAVLAYFLYGAFKWIVSGGDKNSIAQARAMMTHAVIGLVMLILLFIFMQFFTEAIGLGNGFKVIK